MDAFNRDLSSYLDGLHADAREHFTQTLRGCTRLYDAIFHNGHVLVDWLQREIDRAVGRYVAEISAEAPEAFRARRADRFKYVASWSSRLADRGIHTNHIHPEGWISAVYYVTVPDICAASPEKEGWLKFGEPTPDFGAQFAPRHFVQPRAGRLVLFPLYSGTAPCPFPPRNRA